MNEGRHGGVRLCSVYGQFLLTSGDRGEREGPETGGKFSLVHRKLIDKGEPASR